jgi:hypothetical protein
VAAPVQRTPGRRPVPVAVDTHRLRQGLRRTPAVQTPTFWTPTLWTPTAVPGSSSGQPRRPRCPVAQPPDTGRGVRLWRDGGGPAAAAAARHQDRTGRSCSSPLVEWPGRRGQRRTAVRTRGPRTRPTGHREPARPGTTDTRDRRRAWGHCGSGHAGQPAAEASTATAGVRPECDPNVRHRPPRPADRQVRSLGAAGKLASSCKGRAG